MTRSHKYTWTCRGFLLNTFERKEHVGISTEVIRKAHELLSPFESEDPARTNEQSLPNNCVEQCSEKVLKKRLTVFREDIHEVGTVEPRYCLRINVFENSILGTVACRG